jgi:hypothetical protein
MYTFAGAIFSQQLTLWGQRGSSVNEPAREATKLFNRTKKLQRQGDWAGYGETLKKLETR